jgi:hypothetical protein
VRQIQTFDQLARAKGYTRYEVKEKVLAGDLYCRKIANRHFYTTTESAFNEMWEKALDFCDSELQARIIEPAPRLASFVKYYAKEKKRWVLDPGLCRVLVQSLVPERSAQCFFAVSEQSRGYMCLFAEKWKPLVSDALTHATSRMAIVGHVDLKDFARIGRSHHASTSDWAGFVLKHLAHLGWGDLLDGESLRNPLFQKA